MDFKQFTHNFALTAVLLGMLALPLGSLAVMRFKNVVNPNVLSAQDDTASEETLPKYFNARESNFMWVGEPSETSESTDSFEENTVVADEEEFPGDFVVTSDETEESGDLTE